MKRLVLSLILISLSLGLFSQNTPDLKFIFVPHPRSEDKIKQSVYAGIAKIDYTKYAVKMLGGDITYSTSKDKATLNYVDSLFDIGNPNTLWGFGNHDVESGNRALIKQYTGRDSYYAYTRNKVTFMVLDCELNANSFSSTYITGDQLQMVKNVCDTLTDSNFLVLLHSRYIWMINNDYFTDKLDSIAASSKSMDTTNFYSDIYPLLQKVKLRGIQIHVFGGDKSFINVTYSKEDSITFHAARMSTTFADSINNVIVIDYSEQNKTMSCEFVTLSDINKSSEDTTNISSSNSIQGEKALQVIYQGSGSITVQVQGNSNNKATIQIYSINGSLCKSVSCYPNEIQKLYLSKPGLYITKASLDNTILVKKFSIQ
jgi:hypothetical protein